ncbi:hypothetical protein BKA63DRAFT_271680 [Paraphoma chrysanthemicola]|nr:hypothetical protein BKA63DRAFT_271680 [Paraphoma chrysanthemicola]
MPLTGIAVGSLNLSLLQSLSLFTQSSRRHGQHVISSFDKEQVECERYSHDMHRHQITSYQSPIRSLTVFDMAFVSGHRRFFHIVFAQPYSRLWSNWGYG